MTTKRVASKRPRQSEAARLAVLREVRSALSRALEALRAGDLAEVKGWLEFARDTPLDIIEFDVEETVEAYRKRAANAARAKSSVTDAAIKAIVDQERRRQRHGYLVRAARRLGIGERQIKNRMRKLQ